MNKANLKIYPMGGVGEIGSNMTVFETENHLVIIDYGILFPYDDFFDINYLIVDTSQINTEKEITLFITHGHEDHIGAVTHFIKDFPKTKLVAPKFAACLIKGKLHHKKQNFHIQEYSQDDVFKFDEFELHPVHVTHSIPDTYGIIFKQANNDFATLFISDFKYDTNPLFEDEFNTEKIKQVFGPAKKRLAMLDSTNILNQGKTLSESDLTQDLEDIIRTKKRTFITMFSSNIYRLKNILEIGKRNGRKITTLGRSITRYLEAAEESGLIKLSDYPLIDFDSVHNYNDPNLLLLVTGSQGEHLGATRRIVIGEQKNITLTENDQFVFSSKPIPGNEKKIYKLYNQLSEKNVEIIHSRDRVIHASGHPSQRDLLELVNEIDPTDYIPIHGETYFLRAHIKFINENFPQIKTHYLTNFDGVILKNNEIGIFEIAENQPHLIHGDALIIEREKISERRKMACNGVVFISLNHKTQNISLTTKGLPIMADDYRAKLIDFIDYTAFSELKNRDHDYTIEQIRIKVRKFYSNILGYKPITQVHMV